MKTLFFEDPFWLYALLVMAEVVLLLIWRRQRTRTSGLRLLVPPALAALIFGVATLVVTDRERITAAVHEIAKGVAAGQTTALEKYLDDDFHMTLGGPSFGKAKTLARASKVMRTSRITKVKIKRLQIEVKGDTATLRMITAIRVEGGGFRGGVPLVWILRWIKRGKQWRILESTQPRIGTSY
jgi:ketosteroid isomerase-like protein